MREEFKERELYRRLLEEVLTQEARKQRNTLRDISGSLSHAVGMSYARLFCSLLSSRKAQHSVPLLGHGIHPNVA